MRMTTISMKTVLSPRTLWLMDLSFPISDLLTASGIGEYFRISSILHPIAPCLVSWKELNNILESIKCDGLTINCDISFSVKTRLSSSSSFLTLKPQTFEKIAEEIVKWWFYFFTFAMTTASGNRLLSNLNCRSVGRLIISSNEVIKFKILSLNYKINMWSKIEVQWLDCILINPLCK